MSSGCSGYPPGGGYFGTQSLGKAWLRSGLLPFPRRGKGVSRRQGRAVNGRSPAVAGLLVCFWVASVFSVQGVSRVWGGGRGYRAPSALRGWGWGLRVGGWAEEGNLACGAAEPTLAAIRPSRRWGTRGVAVRTRIPRSTALRGMTTKEAKGKRGFPAGMTREAKGSGGGSAEFRRRGEAAGLSTPPSARFACSGSGRDDTLSNRRLAEAVDEGGAAAGIL